MNIREFLLARIAEDEAMAWEVDREMLNIFGATKSSLHSPLESAGSGHDDYPVLTVDPTRVLAECAAKRAIIGPVAKEVVTRWQVGDRTHESIISADQMERWSHGTGPNVDTLRALASVYSDHPDYQKEWAVQA